METIVTVGSILALIFLGPPVIWWIIFGWFCLGRYLFRAILNLYKQWKHHREIGTEAWLDRECK